MELADYQASPTAISIKVKQRFWGSGAEENMKAGYRIQFVGKSGAVLQDVEGTEATYTIRGPRGTCVPGSRSRMARLPGRSR